MPNPIKTIILPLPMRMGSVNCYQVAAEDGLDAFLSQR